MTSSAPDSTSGRAPAFQFYPNDFITDRNVVLMSLQERGAYITLLCFCWLNHLPKDEGQLARLCGVPLATFRKLWPALSVCFRPHPSDASLLINPRLERERQKQADYRAEKSVAGKRGADKRWQKDGTATPVPLAKNSTAIVLPMANDSSSSSSSVFSLHTSSTDLSQKKPVVVADHRSKRPIYTGQRLTVFDWMLDDIYKLLGKQAADALDVHEWFYALDARMAETSQVVPQRDGGKWLQQQTLDEAQRRGLISAPEHKSKLTLALEKASNGW